MISMSEQRIKPGPCPAREKVLAAAKDVAKAALLEVTPASNVGRHAGFVYEGERLVTHVFECLKPGYRGWYWTVTLTRAVRKTHVTVNEVLLRPGQDALLAPQWIPWADRLRPEDVGPSDRLPYRQNDPNLTQNSDPVLMTSMEATDSDADAAQQWEPGLGRTRVLSEEGRSKAYRRWYRSDAGPRNQATRDAEEHCSTCGYLVKMAGSARQVFGACANEWSPFDGRVVSLDHGCGAHSETDVHKAPSLWEHNPPVVDELGVDYLTRTPQC